MLKRKTRPSVASHKRTKGNSLRTKGNSLRSSHLPSLHNLVKEIIQLPRYPLCPTLTLLFISIPISLSYPISVLLIVIFSSSNANFAAQSSKRTTPGSSPRQATTVTILSCRLALEATKLEPINGLTISSWLFSRQKLVSGQK
ncbi:alpha/beta-Hydrolases superfamily protein [Striga asiatica]|uniref:Alpha/beta-Hydrolases superfamily protein n=1 Tax=Striga asiatica TaxID=4170 RepID=A0A5A7RIH1_STRAF|nr:alpha/beta-Hydrolases superfamily protein [Striga asiatica]